MHMHAPTSRFASHASLRSGFKSHRPGTLRTGTAARNGAESTGSRRTPSLVLRIARHFFVEIPGMAGATQPSRRDGVVILESPKWGLQRFCWPPLVQQRRFGGGHPPRLNAGEERAPGQDTADIDAPSEASRQCLKTDAENKTLQKRSRPETDDDQAGPAAQTPVEHLKRHDGGWRSWGRCRFYMLGDSWVSTYGRLMPSRAPCGKLVWLAKRPARWGGTWGLSCSICVGADFKRRAKAMQQRGRMLV